MTLFRRSVQGLGLSIACAAAAMAACSSGPAGNGGLFQNPDAGPNADSASPDAASGPHLGGDRSVVSLAINPPTVTLESLNGTKPTQAFTVVAHFDDGTTSPVTSGVVWSTSDFVAGAIDNAGVFAANGVTGGVVKVNAAQGMRKANATVTVKLHLSDNPAAIAPATQASLQNASQPDASVVWAYPYDGTVFPRGLGAPPLMWTGGMATDSYYVHITSPTFEYETYQAVPPPAPFQFPPAAWQALTDSTTGATDVNVARFSNGAATVVAHHKWTIAAASLRGTVYYWANNLGRVERIKPGASAPDDFANAPPLNDPSMYPQGTCTMTCHTVSADGSTLISGGGVFGGTYDLKAGQPVYNLGHGYGTSAADWQGLQWLMPAVSPTGKYLAVNAQANDAVASQFPNRPAPHLSGMFLSATGALVPNSGIDAMNLFTPAWSPDGKSIAYVTSTDSAWKFGSAPGSLHVMDFDEAKVPMVSNDRNLVDPGADPTRAMIGFPSFTPDGNWIVYQRGTSTGTQNGHKGDLYVTSAKAPGPEFELAALNGTNYNFAAGLRDRDYDYEPAFAPVAAGGYFWVVFTSRRTYGTALTGAADQVKQLWVAAIDQAPNGTTDPSHAAFRLPGQDQASLNMRGFWALDPCKGDGKSCGSGTECCGGYCDASGDGGAPVCMSQQPSCSYDGDRCTQTSDCCNAASGSTCIASRCSEPPPQ